MGRAVDWMYWTVLSTWEASEPRPRTWTSLRQSGHRRIWFDLKCVRAYALQQKHQQRKLETNRKLQTAYLRAKLPWLNCQFDNMESFYLPNSFRHFAIRR